MKKIGIIIFVLLLALPFKSAAAPFTNGGFETGTGAPALNTWALVGYDFSASITGWTVIPGPAGTHWGIDWTGTNFWAAHSGNYSVDMNHDFNGSISQTFDTVANTQYLVEFYLSGNNYGIPVIKTVGVSVDNSFATNETFSVDMTGTIYPITILNYTKEEFLFTATGASTTITFASLNDPSSWYGPVLDRHFR